MKNYPYSLTLTAALMASPAALAAQQDGESAQLDEVTVTATRTQTSQFQTPASVSAVDVGQIRSMGGAVTDVSDVLEGIAGLAVGNRHNYAQDISIASRGSRSGVRGVRVYVDDIPATMPDGQGATTHIDVNSLGRAEMLKGPFSSLYGNSSAGTLLLYTQDGTYPPTVEADGKYLSNHGRYRAVKLAGAAESGAWQNYVVSINRFTTDGYREHSAASKNQANAKFDWVLENGAETGLVFNSMDIKAQDPGGISKSEWQANPRQTAALRKQFDARKHVTQNQAGWHYRDDITPNHSVAVLGYFGERDNEQYLPIPRATQTRNAGHAGGVIDFTRYFYGIDGRWLYRNDDETLQTVVGLSYDAMHDNRKGYENFNGTADGVKGRLRRDESNDIFNLDPYVQLQWRFLPKWRLETGVRYSTVQFESRDRYLENGDDSGRKRYRQWLPTAGLAYRFDDKTVFYTAYSRGFETGTFLEMSYRPDGRAGLNFDLKPLTSNNYEIGLHRDWFNGLLTLALYRTDTQDDIVSAGTVDGRATYRNAGKTRRSGAELGWQGKLYRDWVLALAYNYTDARFGETAAGLEKGKRLPGVAGQAAYARLAWLPASGLRGGVEVKYSDKVYVNDQNSEYAPSYAVTNVFLGYRWQKGRWIFDGTARVDNLFDKNYAETVIVNDANNRYYEPSPGRNYIVGVNLKYLF